MNKLVTLQEIKKAKWFVTFLVLLLLAFVTSNFTGYRYFNFVNEQHTNETSGNGHYYHK